MMSTNFLAERSLRTEVGDYVNLFWPNFARWCGMLWDPKRFPTMTYNTSKDAESYITGSVYIRFPWYARLYNKLFMPRDINKVKDMKKATNRFMRSFQEGNRMCTMEYLENSSKTGEHYMDCMRAMFVGDLRTSARHSVGDSWGVCGINESKRQRT